MKQEMLIQGDCRSEALSVLSSNIMVGRRKITSIRIPAAVEKVGWLEVRFKIMNWRKGVDPLKDKSIDITEKLTGERKVYLPEEMIKLSPDFVYYAGRWIISIFVTNRTANDRFLSFLVEVQ